MLVDDFTIIILIDFIMPSSTKLMTLKRYASIDYNVYLKYIPTLKRHLKSNQFKLVIETQKKKTTNNT